MNRKLLFSLLAGLVALGLAGYFLWQRSDAPPAPKAAQVSTANLPAGAVLRDNGFGEQIPVQATDDKSELKKVYARPYIKEFYEGEYGDEYPAYNPTKRKPLPAFDYGQNLDNKSYFDLVLLRNTLYARNGYCFMNATLRRHFDATNWYRPVWNETMDSTGAPIAVTPILVPLNQQEHAFEQRLLTREKQLLASRVSPQNGYPMIGPDFITNQREIQLPPTLRAALARQNFAIVPTKEEQLFYLYDKGEYAFTPVFVTTDLFLQLLHKYLNGILSDVEEKRLAPIIASMLRQGNTQAQALARQSRQPGTRDAAEWAAAYYAVAQHLLTGTSGRVPEVYVEAASQEIDAASAAEGKGSLLLLDSLYQYSVLKPRGMYTRNDTTRRYFRTVKWLNTAPVFLDSDAGLLRAVALAKALAANPEGSRNFRTFTQVLNVLAGDEDNRSLTNLLQLLASPPYASKTLDELAEPAMLARLRPALLATGTDRIRAKGITAHAQVALDRPTLLFTAGRYSFDGEILSRLTEVRNPRPARPFPKGLDVFASFGNRSAQDVLLNHYREAATWPAYPDTLRRLQRQFSSAVAWDRNLYTKTVQTLLSLNQPVKPTPATPLFIQTPAWQQRNLSTALAGWTELKHDLLLYSEQPMAAEMGGGGGGGPPEPIILAYVEPNVSFWEAAASLLAYQDQALTKLRVNTEHLSGINKEIREKLAKMRSLSQQELRGEKLSESDMIELTQIGGWAEQITFNILKTDRLPDREKHLGLVADVYAYNAGTSESVLEEAVGAADALHVVVEINGTTVVAVGPVFSYYEFRSPTRLTDEEWLSKLATSPPPRPTWLRDLLVPVPKLNTKNGVEEEHYRVMRGLGF
jgi:hypothetical protein